MKKLFSGSNLILLGAAAVAALLIAFSWAGPAGSPTSPADANAATQLAQCLTDKGVKMYGAYWCPHCANQKALVGEDVFNEEVDYVECAIPGQDQRAQTQVCRDAGIEGYPTWIFTDGTRLQGEQSLEKLAQQAGCAYRSE